MLDSLQPCGLHAAHQASLSFTLSWSLLTLVSTELVILSKHLILCCPLLVLPSAFPSFKIFSNELAFHIRWSKYWIFSFSISPSSELALRMRWPKYWSFSFKINPSNEYSGLIAFRTNWFDLPAVQGTLKSLLQQFFSIQPSL